MLLLDILSSKVLNKIEKKSQHSKNKSVESYNLVRKQSLTAPLDVKHLNEDLDSFGFAYDPQKDIFYSNMHCWQRECGYCRLYDEACAPLSMIMECEPIYFDYAGKRWMIEFWKGQYGLNTGCEIGVYNTTADNIEIPDLFNGTFFETAKDEDHLVIGFTLFKQNRVIVTRNEKHWWLTAFKLGEFTHPSNLTMLCEVTLKDEEMLNAFRGGLANAGYGINDYEVNGLTVKLIFDRPKTPQPKTRTFVIDSVMQLNNITNCTIYHFITRKHTNTIDKLNSIKQRSPRLYRTLINIGNTTAIFYSYQRIKEFRNKMIDQIESNFFDNTEASSTPSVFSIDMEDERIIENIIESEITDEINSDDIV